jgi:hypothetical protein
MYNIFITTIFHNNNEQLMSRTSLLCHERQLRRVRQPKKSKAAPGLKKYLRFLVLITSFLSSFPCSYLFAKVGHIHSSLGRGRAPLRPVAGVPDRADAVLGVGVAIDDRSNSKLDDASHHRVSGRRRARS